MGSLLSLVLEPGFFTSEPVHTALGLAGGAAIVSAVVGVFTVLRAQSFAGHTLADVSSAGGAASPLLGISPLLGFLGVAAMAGWAMELVRAENARERDLVTGIVLGAGLGVAALLLYLDVTLASSRSGTTVAIMFGSMFTVPASTIPAAIAISVATLAVIAALYRPLLLCSVSPDLAAVQGVPVRLIGLVYTLALALAVALSAVTIGAILSTALLIGPAATALNIARRPERAIAAAVAIGLATTWGGILMAYDSYYWTPGHSWPVSFCVVVLIFAAYIASRLRRPRPAIREAAAAL